jgi:hypothetical protein
MVVAQARAAIPALGIAGFWPGQSPVVGDPMSIDGVLSFSVLALCVALPALPLPSQ